MAFADDVAARTMYGECRGEPEEGQRAVAYILINRLKDGRWGNSLATVCLWPYQFSCWLPNDPNVKVLAALPDTDPSLAKFGAFIHQAFFNTNDPTFGATHYYSTSMKTEPPWTKGAILCATIGRHRFYKDVH